MPKIPIPIPVLSEIQRQVNDELSAAYAYLALSIWCENENYPGFAGFFKKQSGEETAHAEKLIKHLRDRGQRAELTQVSAPKGEFVNLLEVAKYAQVMEQSNTAGINSAYKTSLETGDFPSQVLLHWFINEQVEEEAWTDELVDRTLKASCAGALNSLDRHVEKYLGSPA
jgi:ferritin